MIKSLKRFLCAALALTLAFPGAFAARAEETKVIMNLSYDGKETVYENRPVTLSLNEEVMTALPMPPIILDDYVYVPAREVFERLGAVVDWKSETRQVYVGYKDTVLVMTVGKAEIVVNGVTKPVSAPPRIINGKTMLPVRFVSEALDFFVHWDKNTYTVTILTPDAPAPAQTPAPIPTPTAEPIAAPPPAQAEGEGEAPEPTQAPVVYTPLNPNVETPVAINGFARDVTQTPLTAEEHPTVRVTGFDAAANEFTVTADGAMSRVDKILLKDNRLILDIYNAEMALPKQTYDVGLSYLKTVRAAQNMVTPQLVTRLVFDITEAVSFSVRLSADRTRLSVRFEHNYIVGVTFTREAHSDRVAIEGVVAPIALLSPRSDKLVIDLPLANVLTTFDEFEAGILVSGMHVSKPDQTTGRVTLDLKRPGQYSVSRLGTSTIITIEEQTIKAAAFFYDAGSKSFTLQKPAGTALSAAALGHTDDYMNLKYTFTLPGDFSKHYGEGAYVINENGVTEATLHTDADGNTRLTVMESKVMAYRVTEDAGAVYIKAVLPKERYKNIIVIDPGHGGSDPGGDSGGIVEKGYNLDVALRLIKLIEAEGSVKVYSTRLDDTYPTRSERAAMGNELADVFLSIHHNKFNKVASGTETLWMPHKNDEALGFPSEKMAGIFQKNVLAAIGTKDRRVAYQDLQVLRESVIPGVLVEICFMDSEPDRTNMQTEAFRQKAAEGLLNGILETFRVYTPAR